MCSKPDHGYYNLATQILREKNYSLFEEKSQEYVRSYANLFFDDYSDYYLFQDINAEITKESFSKEINCVFVQNNRCYKLSLNSPENLRDLIKRLMSVINEQNLQNNAFIIGNKIYNYNNSDNKILSNYKTMFIISKALPY